LLNALPTYFTLQSPVHWNPTFRVIEKPFDVAIYFVIAWLTNPSAGKTLSKNIQIGAHNFETRKLITSLIANLSCTAFCK